MRKSIKIATGLMAFSMLAGSAFAKTNTQQVKTKLKQKKKKSKSNITYNLSINQVYKTNPDKIATYKGTNSSNQAFESKPLYEDVLFQSLSLGANYKFRPTRRLIVTDSANIAGDIQTNTDKSSDQIRFAEISNSLQAQYFISRYFQSQAKFDLGAVKDYRYKYDSGSRNHQKVIKDHFYGDLGASIRYRQSKFFNVSLGAGVLAKEYDSDYNYYDSVDGQQDDHLKSYYTLTPQLNVNKQVKLETPVEYNKKWYKNKVAYNNVGSSIESGWQELETLEYYSVGASLSVKLSETLSLKLFDTLGWQNDLSFGGQDYRSDSFGGSFTWSVEQTSFNIGYSQERYRYENSLLDTSNQYGPKVVEVTHAYSAGLGIKKPFNLPADLNLSVSRELHRHNYTSGRFDLDVAQLGISIPL